MQRLFTTALLLAACATSHAQGSLTYICTQDKATRVITVEYSTSEPVPCAVTYTKNGQTQTLWKAQNTDGYCEQKAKAFVEKQKSWGWQCNSENFTLANEE